MFNPSAMEVFFYFLTFTFVGLGSSIFILSNILDLF